MEARALTATHQGTTDVLSTRVAESSPSTSSATIRTGLPAWKTFLVQQRDEVLDAADLGVDDQDVEVLSMIPNSMRSASVTKYAEM